MDTQKSLSCVYPVRDKRIFKGDEKSPFLAPRGVFIHENLLLVADTGQNRVFIWKEFPKGTHQAADLVLGQDEQHETGRNKNKFVTGASLQYPSGIWSDGKRLVVADAWNHRVLIWHTFPTHNGQQADVVLGQPDFTSNEPNVYGLGKAPSAKSLYWCYGVFVHNEKLFIADTGNRRVLVYHTLPKENYAAADAVIGATSFTEKEYDPQSAIWPYSIKLSEQGEVAITDTQYFRVLYWANVEDALHKSAAVVFGQPDLVSNGQNQYLLKPDAHTLNWCYDSQFFNGGLWIADTGNSRLLWHPEIAKQNNAKALQLIGHGDFVTGSENMETVLTTEHSLYWPFSLSCNQHEMAVADTGNHRIILYKLI
ncbi:MAG: hypothetical protein ACK57K_05315 [Chryseotalea sp.]|jgi:hypothetical protein